MFSANTELIPTECYLCVRRTPGYIYLVAHTMVTAIVVLPSGSILWNSLPDISFDRFTEDVFVLGDGIAALCD